MPRLATGHKTLLAILAVVAILVIVGVLSHPTPPMQDAKALEDEAADYYDISKIPRVQVARALYDYLEEIQTNPLNKEAYDGAVNSYCELGAVREASNLRDSAARRGVPTGTMDSVLDAFGLHSRRATAPPPKRAQSGHSDPSASSNSRNVRREPPNSERKKLSRGKT